MMQFYVLLSSYFNKTARVFKISNRISFTNVKPSVNHLAPNGHYMGLTAQLTSRCCILYIYSTNIRTEYFKYAA